MARQLSRTWLILLLLLLLTPPADRQVAAQTYDVCPTGCRYASIQTAINAAAAGSTLTVGPGVYRETLVLKAGVNITGAGVGQTTVQGNGASTVITASGAQIQRTTVLQGLTVTGGGGAGPGGMNIAGGAAPTLRNLRISGNVVNAGPAGGGLMISGSGNPLLENVEIRNNQASAGAGLTLWEGRATLRNCTIADNISQGPRGVIYGAVYLDEGSELTMANTVISGSASASGGGMVVLGGSKATITDSRFQDNQASTQGGAIFVRSASTLTLDRVVLIGNSSVLDGGAVTISQAVATIDGSEFIDNTAERHAGALNVVLNSQVTLRDSLVASNRAQADAGGMTIQDGSQALLERNVFRDNQAPGSISNPLVGVGGAIKVYGAAAHATIRYNRFEGNTAKDGGGLYVEHQASAEISGNEIVANHVTEYGGGIVVNDHASAQIIANVIANNRSSGDGGGVWIHDGATARAEGNVIAGNHVEQRGGGLVVSEGAALQGLDNLIIGNMAAQHGGGAWIVEGSTSLFHNRIRRNSAGGNGGGVLLQGSTAGPSELRNNLLEGNHAGGAGAGVYVTFSGPTLVNNSIVANGRGETGAGLSLGNGAAPALTNNVIAGNDYGIQSGGGSPSVTARNDVYDNRLGNYNGVTPGAADLSVDPLFVHGFYLSHSAAGQNTNSPLINAGQGTASSLGLHTRTTRTDGVPDQGVVDLGYHYPLPIELDPNRPTVFIPLLMLGN
jgi:predicted outer membrane repeat protein